MLTVAYLANRFPSAVEPYVTEEIEELRSRGIRVIAGSVLKARKQDQYLATRCAPEVVLQSLQGIVLLRALWLFMRHWNRISPLVMRLLFRGREGPLQRARTLLHTLLGACYAARLQTFGIDHIHVHHGFFGSWVAMVAARLLGVPFSMTLHGSDLLLRARYLDVKLAHCAFCLTVSEYNRRYILDHYPEVDPSKILTARLGVEVHDRMGSASRTAEEPWRFTMLAVGRLHAVKDYAFLVRACASLAARDVPFKCLIAGEGPERRHLTSLIRTYGLDGKVSLLGHVLRERMNALYDCADVLLMTSRSEGIPLVLMEAMARGKIVLAPAITGIPELVIPGQTGFLYEPGSQSAFVGHLLFIYELILAEGGSGQEHHPDIPWANRHLDRVRHAAQAEVRLNFNRKKNLMSFADLFLGRITPQTESDPDESFILQQI